MRAPILLSLLTLFALSGCGNTQEMDLTFFNAGPRPLFVEAGADSGMRVGVEVDVDGEWIEASPSLALMCIARCGVIEVPACPPVVPELAVLQVIGSRSSVTRRLEGSWWYEDPALGCARRAPLKNADLRAVICHDDRGVFTDSGEQIEAPESTGLVGLTGGAHLLAPFCQSSEFDLWLASADTFNVSAQ